MLMCSSFPDDVLGAGAEPKGETNEPKVKKKIYTVLIKRKLLQITGGDHHRCHVTFIYI